MCEFVGMETKNIPIINLRNEFEDHLGLLKQEAFRLAVFNCAVEPVRLKNFMWYGLPHDLLTLMLQRSVVGLECYLCAAVHFELSRNQRLTKESEDAIDAVLDLVISARLHQL